jgi:alpha-tubulin suppressor-like RCC1 family protein
VTVTGVATADAVACGSTFSLALLANGSVVAWGDNSFGQLGDGTTTDSTTPVVVTGLTGITKIDATSDTAVALASDGTVWTWGAGGSGQLGDGTSTPSQTTPVQVTIVGETIVDIDCGDSAVLVITADGSRYAWGSNTTGVFGDGLTTSSNTPELVTNF